MKMGSVFAAETPRADRWHGTAQLRLTLAAIQTVSLLACTDLTPPLDATPEVRGPVIMADKDWYSWTIDKVAVFTLSNPEGASVFWSVCPAFRLQRYDNGWKTVRTPDGVFALDGVCDPRRLAPGQTIEHRISLTNDWIPRSGWYRLELTLVRDSNPDLPWALRSRTSPSVSIAPWHAQDGSGQ